MKKQIVKGSTSQIVTVFIQDDTATDGVGLGSLDQNSSIVGGYVREGATGLALAVNEDVATEGTYQAPTSGSVRIGTPANMTTGTYELHFHNDLFAAGADSVFITLHGATDMAPLIIEIQLTTFNLNSSTPTVDAIEISGSAAAADNLESVLLGTGDTDDVDLSCRKLDIINDAGVGLTVTGTTIGFDLNATAGIAFDVDSTGSAIDIDSQNAVGISILGDTNGVDIAGNNGDGMTIDGGSGAGMAITGTTFGVSADGSAGPGVQFSGTTFGFQITASNGPAMSAVSNGGNGDGIVATANGSGLDINAVLATVTTCTTTTTNTDMRGTDNAATATNLAAADVKLDRNADLAESIRGHHAWSGNYFYVDPVNGNNGNAGTRAAPRLTIQSVHDDLVTANNHDVIFLVPGAAGGITTHTVAATTMISKGRTLLRGPGSDGFVITRTGAGDTLSITGDGCEVSGVQIGTAATGSGDGIDVTGADRVWIHHCTFLDTQGDGVHIQGSSKARVEFCLFDGTGVGGSGQGVHITGVGPTTSNDNVIHSCHFARTGGDSILIEQGTTNDTDIHHNAIHDAGGWGINIGASSEDAIVHSNVFGNNASGDIRDVGTDTVLQNNEQWGKQSLLVYAHFTVHIDDVDGVAGSVEGTNGTQGNPVDNLADAVLLTAGLGIKDYELHGSTDIILTTPHANWHFSGHNGSSVDPDGQNINGAHFDCLTLKNNLGGDDISARFCKLQSLTNATGSYDFCQLIDNATLVAGDTHFFQCASGVAGTGTPYIDLDGDDANARNLHLRGWLGGVELRTHTSTDTTSFDCPAGQIIVAASSTGGTVAMRGNINITDNASGAVTFSQNAAVNMSKVNAEVLDVMNVDTHAEPGQGAPGATLSIFAKINFLYKNWRNKKTQSTTEFDLFADDGSTVDQKATVSDVTSVTTKGEIESGP